MIKKTLFLLVSAFLVISSFAPKVYSQGSSDTEFDKSYREYSLKVEDYNKAHEGYVLTRSSYLRFKTLQAKTDAMVATLKMLEARDEVFIMYLAALKEKLKETKGIDEGKRNAVNSKINEETSWLSDHKSRLPSAGSLEDLVADSDEVKKRHKEKLESLFYEILITVAYGKVSYYRDETTNQISAIKDVFSQIKEEEEFSTGKLQLIDRWIFDSEAKVERAQSKQIEIDNLLSTISTKQSSFTGAYDKVITTLKESQQYLKEATSFLKEVVREIKTAE